MNAPMGDRGRSGQARASTGSGRSLLARSYGGCFLIAFGLSAVMLGTDNNLWTGFGSVSGYYFHWWVVLITAAADLIGAILLLALGTRLTVKGGLVGSSLLTLVFLADILTYQQNGFNSPADFANYLFGVTYSGGDVRYLYDILLAVYIVTAVVGAIVLLRTRPRPRVPVPESASPPSGEHS